MLRNTELPSRQIITDRYKTGRGILYYNKFTASVIGKRIRELVACVFSLLTAERRKSFGVEDEGESLAVVRLVTDFRVSHWL